MTAIALTDVRKSFGAVEALREVSLEARAGEFLTLLGPSGCGKTTTLRMVAGFVEPTAGTIRFGARDVTRVPVHKRNVGMVFQGYALFPHLTVAKNIEFGLKVPVFWLMTARVEGRYADLCAALPVELIPTRTLSPLDRHDAERLFEACLGPAARGPAGGAPTGNR